MTTLIVIELILAVTIIVLAGIAMVATASLLVQSASATTDVMTTTTLVGGEEQEAASSTTTTNNVSNAVLGSVFSFGEGTEATVNPINEIVVPVAFGGIIILLPKYDTTIYVSFIR